MKLKYYSGYITSAIIIIPYITAVIGVHFSPPDNRLHLEGIEYIAIAFIFFFIGGFLNLVSAGFNINTFLKEKSMTKTESKVLYYGIIFSLVTICFQLLCLIFDQLLLPKL